MIFFFYLLRMILETKRTQTIYWQEKQKDLGINSLDFTFKC